MHVEECSVEMCVDVQVYYMCDDVTLNQEKVCEEATSFDLTSLDIACCIADVDYLLQDKKEELIEGDGGSCGYKCICISLHTPIPPHSPYVACPSICTYIFSESISYHHRLYI